MKGKVSSGAGIYWPIFPKWGDRQVCLITCWAGGATAKAHQPQRGDMFIAQPNRNLRKPRRGGMVPSRTGHAAPTGLAEKIGGVVVAINMSLLRSWPNPAHALDGWIPSLLDAGHDRPSATEEHRWAAMRAERAKLKSCKDDEIIAQGKAAEAAALGKGPNQPTSFFPSGFARPCRAKPEGKKEGIMLRL